MKARGFTIVELLIVIVVIGILASITVVAFTGVQTRARDTARIHDMRKIQEALNMYYIDNGRYPTPTSANGSWEESWEDNPSNGDFMEQLVAGGYMAKVPLDPTNSSSAHYRYYRYSHGATDPYNCDVSRGPYYVLGVVDMQSSGRPHADSPGFSCSGRNWGGEFDWVTGEYEQ